MDEDDFWAAGQERAEECKDLIRVWLPDFATLLRKRESRRAGTDDIFASKAAPLHHRSLARTQVADHRSYFGRDGVDAMLSSKVRGRSP